MAGVERESTLAAGRYARRPERRSEDPSPAQRVQTAVGADGLAARQPGVPARRCVRPLPARLRGLHLADRLAPDRAVPLHRPRELPRALLRPRVPARGRVHVRVHAARDAADLPRSATAWRCCCARTGPARGSSGRSYFLPFVVGLTTVSFMFAIELQPGSGARGLAALRTAPRQCDAGVDSDARSGAR